MLASINPLAAAEVVKKKPPAKKKPPIVVTPATHPHVVRPPTPYRATFFDNVRNRAKRRRMSRAEKMDVDFLVESDQTSATQPATAPTSATPVTQPAHGDLAKPTSHPRRRLRRPPIQIFTSIGPAS